MIFMQLFLLCFGKNITMLLYFDKSKKRNISYFILCFLLGGLVTNLLHHSQTQSNDISVVF